MAGGLKQLSFLTLIVILVLGASTARAFIANPPPGTTILYVTDLEGDLKKWREFIETSGGFTRANGALKVKPGYLVIFGGDVMDHFAGDHEILAEMVPLAEDQPQQFIIIGGNRDYNKLPLIHRLGPQALRRFFDSVNAKYLFQLQTEQLNHELRQPATDQQVADSVYDLVAPQGLLTRYLRAAHMGAVIGNTLIVHGAWKRNTQGPRPGFMAPFKTYRERVVALTQWKNQQIENWQTRRGDQGAELMAYQSNRAGVVYGHYSDENWNPHMPDPHWIEELQAEGIDRIVVGHRQYGLTPAVLRRNTFEMIMADNSSNPEAGVSIVEIRDDVVRLRNSHFLRGEAMDFSWKRGESEIPLGSRTTNGELIVGKTVRGQWLVFKNPGSNTTLVPEENLVRAGADQYAIQRREHLVTDAQLEEWLNIAAPKPRVAALADLHGQDLTPAQHERLMARATQLSNSFEIGQYIRIAGESARAEWLPILQTWLNAWQSPTERWQGFMASSARDAIPLIACSKNLKSSE